MKPMQKTSASRSDGGTPATKQSLQWGVPSDSLAYEDRDFPCLQHQDTRMHTPARTHTHTHKIKRSPLVEARSGQCHG